MAGARGGGWQGLDERLGLSAVLLTYRRLPAAIRLITPTVLTSVVILVITLGSGIVLARNLGPTGRGDLAIAMLWPPLIAGIGGLGVAEATAYVASREDLKRSSVLSSSLVLAVAQSAVLMLLGYLVLPHLLSGRSGSLLGPAYLYLWIIPLIPLALYQMAVLQGRMDLRAYNLSRLSSSITYTSLLIGLAGWKAVTVENALIASLAASIVTLGVVSAVVVSRGYAGAPVRFDLWLKLLSFGGRLHVGNIANMLAARIDIIALTFLASSAELGNYVVASAVAGVANLVASSTGVVIYPLSSRQAAASMPLFLSRFLLVAGLLTVCVGPILVLALPWTLPIVFGPTFQRGMAMAQILVVAYLIRGWGGLLSTVVRGRNRPLRASLGEVIGLIVMALLLPLLTPQFGGVGAGYAVAFGATAMLLWMILQAFRASELTVHKLFQYWKADIHRVRHRANH